MSRPLLVVLALLLVAGCAPAAPAPAITAKPASPSTPQAVAQPTDSIATSVPTRAAAPTAVAATAQPTAATKPAAAVPTGSVTVIQGPTLVRLDATMVTGMLTFNPAIHIFDTLTWRDEQSNVKPLLATEWSYPNDKTIRLKLQKGVKFHNGDPLTADDVVFTYKMVIDPANKSQHLPYVKTIDDVKKVDDETVEFALKTPDATLLGRFSLIPIVPKKVYEALGPDGFNDKPVGTGPYKLQEWVKGQRVVLEANTDYWRGAPKIKTIIFKSITEDNTRITELLTGNADIVTNVPPELATQVKATPTLDLQQVQSLRNIFMVLNGRKAPLSDPRVRQALNYAIDLKLLISTVLGGYGVPTPGGVMGPGVWGHFDDYAKGYQYDPEKAKQLLADAGVKPGTKLTIRSPQGRYLADREVVQAVSGMLQAVGIDAEIQLLDFDFLTDEYIRKYNDESDIILFSNANNTADADYNYSLNFLSTARGIYWSTPEVDALINQARGTMDVQARLKLYQDIGAAIAKEAPVIFGYDQVDAYGVSKRLQGFKARPDELMYLYESSVSN